MEFFSSKPSVIDYQRMTINYSKIIEFVLLRSVNYDENSSKYVQNRLVVSSLMPVLFHPTEDDEIHDWLLYLSNWNHKQQGKEKWRGKRSVWTSQGNPSLSFQGSPAKFSTHLHELMVWINIYQSLTKGPVMTWLASVVVPPARTMRINWHLKRRVFSQTITIAGWCFGTWLLFFHNIYIY